MNTLSYQQGVTMPVRAEDFGLSESRTDNEVPINKALQAAARGDAVTIGIGDFTVGATINIPNHVSLVGSGPGGTVLRARSNGGYDWEKTNMISVLVLRGH